MEANFTAFYTTVPFFVLYACDESEPLAVRMTCGLKMFDGVSVIFGRENEEVIGR